jgi:hypothetical protein
MARKAVYIRIILEEMGHKQPATPLQTNSAMAKAVTNGKVQPKLGSAGEMIRDPTRLTRASVEPDGMSFSTFAPKGDP